MKNPQKLTKIHLRGPKLTMPAKYVYGFKRLLRSSAIKGPPESPEQESMNKKS